MMTAPKGCGLPECPYCLPCEIGECNPGGGECLGFASPSREPWWRPWLLPLLGLLVVALVAILVGS